jgi:catechol 2,3-dioxygenase-like lactoylglutathione lyase family enzyme
MKIHSIAGFATITKNPQKSTRLYKELLGLPLKNQEGYLFTDEISGCNHFGVCTLSMAAQFCFGTSIWPEGVPEPNSTLEFELGSPAEVADAMEQLKANGQEFVHEVKLEPWGQTMARFISPENVLIGLSYTPWLHN